MSNFASLRGPLGLNRVYVNVPPGPLNHAFWLDGVKHGRTFATNGPLLGFSLGDQQVGEDLKLPAGENKVKLTAWMRSIVPIDHLQVICNGELVRDLKLSGDRQSADISDTLPISRSGWCVLRAWSEKSEYPILDLYPYATTSPIYIAVAGSNPSRKEDAAYFVAWIDRMIQSASSNQDWNNEAEKDAVLKLLDYARSIYIGMEK